MVYTGLYNAGGQRQVTIVSGSSYTGLMSADGQYNGVLTTESTTLKGLYHACGAYNVTATTSMQMGMQAPDGSRYVYKANSGYVLPGGTAGTYAPSWVVNPGNAPDLAVDWTINQFFTKSTGATSTAASKVTVVNSTGGYVNNAAGTWTSIAPNTPRISDLGLLVEEARTNSIRNNSMQGTVPGTPGTLPTNWSVFSANGIVTNVIGTGTQNGVDYVDLQFVGTTTNTFYVLSFESPSAIAASAAQAWSASAFYAVVGGALTNITTLSNQMRFQSGAANNVDQLFTPSASLTRQNNVAGVAGASVANVVQTLALNFSSGVAVNVTLRIGWPQLELGASVTSPIRTTAAAVLRAADVVTLTSPPTFGNAYSLYAKGTPQAPIAYGTNQGLGGPTDGAGTNRTFMFRSSATGNPVGVDISSTGAYNSGNIIPTGTWAQNTNAKMASAWAALDGAVVYNGGTPATLSTIVMPTGLNAYQFGTTAAGGSSFNGFLEYNAIFLQRVPNAQLQSMTT